MIGTKILEERKSKYNGDLRVAKTLGIGTYIQADELTQSGGIVESIWSRTLRHIDHKPLTINHCLILGLGGGTVAKLVRKKWPEAKIGGVEIDPIMTELGKKYLGLDDEDVDIELCDAFEFLKRLTHKPRQYDLIIIDLYNGDKFPDKFGTGEFLHLVRINLSRSGIAIFNRLYYGEKRPDAVKFGDKLKKVFKNVEWFYPEANLMLICKK